MQAIEFIKKVIKKVWPEAGMFREKLIFRSKDRKETFSYIYQKNLWGGKKDTGQEQYKYYSGEGSHDERYVEPYCRMIQKFISQNNISTVVDIGCGDFNVASGWLNENIIYSGIDIVQEMIDHHNERYSTENIHFYCLDAVEEDLPDAELCLVRQVLQHLSNEEVSIILEKLKKYKYVIITEHVTKKEFASKYNIDKSHGDSTRVSQGSGLYLDEAPFNYKIKTLLEIPYDEKDDVELISVQINNSNFALE